MCINPQTFHYIQTPQSVGAAGGRMEYIGSNVGGTRAGLIPIYSNERISAYCPRNWFVGKSMATPTCVVSL